MRPRDLVLAVGVAAVWGINFVMIRLGLDDLPPLLFNALRFGLAAFPALLFVGRPGGRAGGGQAPTVKWRWVVAVALTLAVVKFSLLFFAIDAGMPAGLSSVVLQSQAVFTVIFAALLLRERPRPLQVGGLIVATAGVALVGWRLGPDRPVAAFLLVLAAAAAWGISNVAMRRAGAQDMLVFMVWVSAVATPFLVVLTLAVDGPAADLAALRAITWPAVLSLLYISGLATLAGWAVWGSLIRRYGASTVAPVSMLVPFFGIASAALFLHEPVHFTDLVGGLLVVGGVLAAVVAPARSNSAVRIPSFLADLTGQRQGGGGGGGST